MLTNDQINKLYFFARSKGIHYYDVQSELVDHLAERIEQLQILNKTASFEELFAFTKNELTNSGIINPFISRENNKKQIYKAVLDREVKTIFKKDVVLSLLLFLALLAPMFFSPSYFNLLVVRCYVILVPTILLLQWICLKQKTINLEKHFLSVWGIINVSSSFSRIYWFAGGTLFYQVFKEPYPYTLNLLTFQTAITSFFLVFIAIELRAKLRLLNRALAGVNTNFPLQFK